MAYYNYNFCEVYLYFNVKIYVKITNTYYFYIIISSVQRQKGVNYINFHRVNTLLAPNRQYTLASSNLTPYRRILNNLPSVQSINMDYLLLTLTWLDKRFESSVSAWRQTNLSVWLWHRTSPCPIVFVQC